MGPLAAGTIVASAVQLGVSKETPVHAKRGIHPPRIPYFDYTRYTFSMGVEKRGFLWLSGQTAAEYDPVRRQTVCKGDLVEQTRVVYEKMRLTLEAGGAGFADVVKTVDYVTPAARPRYRDTAAVRREYFGNSFPAATGVVIERLLRPDALIEVEAIAHIDAQPKRPVNLGLERFAHLTYQPAVESAGILWISGHMAQEAASGTGAPVYRGGIVGQTRTIYERVLLILEAAGANFGGVVVQGLPQPDWLIAVDAVAVVSEVRPVTDGQ